MATVTVDRITKVFDKTVKAVNDLNMEITDGSVVSLLGPSGCGKTTTMRMIAGLEQPTEGRILINGKDVTELRPQERDIAMVFQLPVTYDNLTVYENMHLPMTVKKFTKKEAEKRIDEVMELFDIPKSYLQMRVSLLGLSDRQRISLAHAFVVPRNLYLLDEPLSNLDPKGREDLRIKIKDVQMKIGQTILYVTHDQSEALTLADKIAIMKQGKILQYSETQEIFRHPSNTFVGWFLGNPGMNFIDCDYRSESGEHIFRAGSFEYKARNGLGKFEPGGGRITLGIRPENIAVGSEMKEGWLLSRCDVIEPIGNRLLLFQKIGDTTIVVKTRRIVDIKEGSDVWIHFPPEHLRFFDPETGNTLTAADRTSA